MLKGLEESLGIRVKTYGRRIGALTYYSGGDGVCKPRLWYRVGLIFKQRRYWNTVIEQEAPDCVMVNSQILCWMSRLKSVKCRKSVCFVRETLNGSPRRPLNRVISCLLDRFNTVVFLSDHDKKMMGLKRANAEVVHNYVQESQFDTSLSRADASNMLGLSEDTFHVLYVGGVSHMKGFDLCVDAVLKAGKSVELIVAGNDFTERRAAKPRCRRTVSLRRRGRLRRGHYVRSRRRHQVCPCDSRYALGLQ
jgi:glycosyltransferase involved in cell wall biosynthesis